VVACQEAVAQAVWRIKEARPEGVRRGHRASGVGGLLNGWKNPAHVLADRGPGSACQPVLLPMMSPTWRLFDRHSHPAAKGPSTASFHRLCRRLPTPSANGLIA